MPQLFSRKEEAHLKSEIDEEIYVVDEIPFEERRVIDELVELWQTRHEPQGLFKHIAGTYVQGGAKVTWFFGQVRQDLLTDRRSNYAVSSASEFKQFLEEEYHRLDQANTKRQARAKVRADFDALGKEMAKATTRAELINLGRKRATLASLTGDSYVYESHCWKCSNQISSAINAQCLDCKRYICNSCGSCLCGFFNY